MKIIVATSQGQGLPKDVFECKELEIVRFGLLQTKNNVSGVENTMSGITSNGNTSTVIAKELNITQEFYYEMIKESIENEFGVNVDEDGKFTVNLHAKFKFNLKEIIEALLKAASYMVVEKIYRINGRNLIGTTDYVVEKKQGRLPRKREASNE